MNKDQTDGAIDTKSGDPLNLITGVVHADVGDPFDIFVLQPCHLVTLFVLSIDNPLDHSLYLRNSCPDHLSFSYGRKTNVFYLSLPIPVHPSILPMVENYIFFCLVCDPLITEGRVNESESKNVHFQFCHSQAEMLFLRYVCTS